MNVIDLVDGNAYEQGADGYIIKGGQGMLEYNWRDLAQYAVLEGKPYGLYWLIDARYSPEAHKAAIKLAFPTGEFGKLGLWLDIEKPTLSMTDAQYNALPYCGYKTVESVWRGVAAYTGVYPGMYFGPGSWDLIMNGVPLALQDEFADKCPAWIAHYTSAPAPMMRGQWQTWALWQWREGPDYNRVNAEWWAAVMGQDPAPVVFHVKRARADVLIEYTPAASSMPILNVLDHARAHGWSACMNAGAGFDYTDADHATPRTAGFSAVLGGLNYTRRLIAAGVINPNLVDNPNVAPWSILAFDAANVHLIVTQGMEGAGGLTQLQAAEYCARQGLTDAYLMDSGHSSQIEQRGVMLYWPYQHLNERVPQAVGLRELTNGGSMSTKGTVRPAMIANVKSMATGAQYATMRAGDYVFGDLSPARTDIINFTHYYTAAGARMDLPAAAGPCKVSLTNMTYQENALEPGGTNPPPAGVPHMRQILRDTNGDTWLFECDGVKQ